MSCSSLQKCFEYLEYFGLINGERWYKTVQEKSGKILATLYEKLDESMHYIYSGCSSKGRVESLSEAHFLCITSLLNSFESELTCFDITLNELTSELKEVTLTLEKHTAGLAAFSFICRKMRDACLACRHCEEDKYWSGCQPVQFCQILSWPFIEQLVIPKKFAENVREKLAETVTLKVPSGSIWNVGLISDGDTYVIKQGWKEFVKDNFLEEKDILIFKYNGDSIFDVNMFDQKTSCEREASHFATKCEHSCKRKRKGPRRIEDEDIESSDDDDDDYHPVKSPRRSLLTRTNAKACRAINEGRCRSSNGVGGNPLQLTFHRTAVTGEEAEAIAASLVNSNVPGRAEDEDTDELSDEYSDDVDYIQVKNRRNVSANMPTLSRLPTRSNAKARRGKKKPLKCISHRRAVTEEEKEQALERAKANAASSENCFTVVMRPTHVYRRFFLTLPTKWARVNVRPKNQDFVLRTELDTFKAKYHCRGDGGGLNKGWDNFVVHNFLEEFDVCVFHLASGINDDIILDVSIFRVVEGVIPPECPSRDEYIEAHILSKLQVQE